MTTKNLKIDITNISTDLGLMIAAATDSGICLLDFDDCKHTELKLKQLAAFFKASIVSGDNPHFETLKKQLDEYFKGVRKSFEIQVDIVGTLFQKQVWYSLLQIPYGGTTNYAAQAKLIGKPTSVRAVANANGKNKVSIILPCHRVIGADGSLTGYGGGLWRKQKLLELETKNKF